MSILTINGPSKLKGKVEVQGAKNSAMKHIFIPLIYGGEYILENIPRIGSTDKHFELAGLFGSKITWLGKNTVNIDTKKDKYFKRIPKEFIYYTSGGNQIIPIIASKYGTCEVETLAERNDYGGDQIGSRKFQDVSQTLVSCGFKYEQFSSFARFTHNSKNAIKLNVPSYSFGASVNILFSSLFRKGKSTINNYTRVPEFEDVVNFLVKAGAKIKKSPTKLEVFGPTKLNNIIYKNMYDPHDFVTWLFAGLATNSNIVIENVEYEKMKLDVLEKVFKEMKVDIDLHSPNVILKSQVVNLKPISIFSGRYPMFTTEWQVLISPLLTQISGESIVIETLFANRMQHWSEMAKMGVKHNYFKYPKYSESEGNPRAVKVTGPQYLHSAVVNARDVRTGACLLIASLIAKGETTIQNTEHIYRGYEDMTGRLNKLGVKINELS